MAKSLPWRIYYHRMWVQLLTTYSDLLKEPNGELLVAVNHNQLRTMASETVDPIDWSHPPPYKGQYPWAPRIAHCNASCKSQDLLHWVNRERATFIMPMLHACARTYPEWYIYINILGLIFEYKNLFINIETYFKKLCVLWTHIIDAKWLKSHSQRISIEIYMLQIIYRLK